MVSILFDKRPTVLDARVAGDALWINKVAFTETTSWTLKPQGFCKDEVCVPIPAGREADFVGADSVNMAAFWRHLGNPVLSSQDGETWMLGEGAEKRATALLNLEAPDFHLPDLDGKQYSLSQFRGKKVLLVSWASW